MDKIKESLEYSKYADTYSYLYSFCLKLTDFADPQFISKYRTLAKTLLNRSKIPKEEFRKVIEDISMIEKEINDHLSINI